MAERAGFEPARGCPQHAFQACALNRSAISPNVAEHSGADWRLQWRRFVKLIGQSKTSLEAFLALVPAGIWEVSVKCELAILDHMIDAMV